MLDTIEKLLVLQDRDRKIHRVQEELAHISPERQGFQTKAATAQTHLDAAKTRVKQIESERKRLEIEVESKKSQIEKYANKQLQTRKNEEYKALAQEIEHCKAEITKIEDHEIELMEQAEAAQREVLRAMADAGAAKTQVEKQVTELNQRETNLKKDLAEFQQGREELAAAVDDSARHRYERLLRSKGDNVIVGINHGVCGGCHMKLPAQILVNCKSEKEIVSCSNCGRILYYTRDMELAAAD
ncbi:MAG TPA: C4-type zinc ribbon domain-containing protein [Verrucomicrobiae bacterium]|nr:C4-type zinc ribbon domain-containing protein [Verrucomicrobiae bacterium]